MVICLHTFVQFERCNTFKSWLCAFIWRNDITAFIMSEKKQLLVYVHICVFASCKDLFIYTSINTSRLWEYAHTHVCWRRCLYKTKMILATHLTLHSEWCGTTGTQVLCAWIYTDVLASMYTSSMKAQVHFVSPLKFMNTKICSSYTHEHTDVQVIWMLGK